MTRQLRIEYEGAFYHITSRGNEKKRIFYSRSDYEKFKFYLREAIDKYACRLHCYVLMSNHYHLLIETLKANLSRILHYINTSYSNYFNLKEKRVGHLFQGRYKAILIDSDNYLLEASRYLHLNPVRAKINEKPEDYPYSSYRTYIFKNKKDIVSCDLILKMIGGDPFSVNTKNKYKGYVELLIGEKIENPFEKLKAGVILGSKQFANKTLQRLKTEHLNKKGIAYRKSLIPSSDFESILDIVCKYFNVGKKEVLNKKDHEYTNIIIYLLKKFTELPNEKIGNLFGNLSHHSVSKRKTRFVQSLKKNPILRKNLDEIIKMMSMSNVEP